MTKFQSRFRTWRNFAVLMLLLVAGVAAIHFVKFPMIEPWNPPIAVEEELANVEVKIEVVYVTGNGIRLRPGPSKAHEPINAFNWCKSFIVFGNHNEWVEVGDTEPMGWMHEAFLTNEQPDRCVEAAVEYPTLLRQAGWDLIEHVKEVNR